MAFTSGSGQGPMSEINVTPMVDVMLVLLVIFMITAPMMQQGVKVELPSTESAAMPEPDSARLVVTLTADHRAFIGSSEVPRERLGELLSANAKLKRDKELYLHADHRLPYGVVVAVMAAAKKAGADSIGMVTDPNAPPPSDAAPSDSQPRQRGGK